LFTRGYGVGDAKTTPHPSDFVRALQTALLESRHTAYGRKQSFVDGSYRPKAAIPRENFNVFQMPDAGDTRVPVSSSPLAP